LTSVPVISDGDTHLALALEHVVGRAHGRRQQHGRRDPARVVRCHRRRRGQHRQDERRHRPHAPSTRLPPRPATKAAITAPITAAVRELPLMNDTNVPP
jgi:hypothetical protein